MDFLCTTNTHKKTTTIHTTDVHVYVYNVSSCTWFETCQSNAAICFYKIVYNARGRREKNAQLCVYSLCVTFTSSSVYVCVAERGTQLDYRVHAGFVCAENEEEEKKETLNMHVGLAVPRKLLNI